MWRKQARGDAGLMRQVFAASFFGFGASGRVYRLEEILMPMHDMDFEAVLPLENLSARHLAQRVVHVTYVSEITVAGRTERANRSSIRAQENGAWRLTFH